MPEPSELSPELVFARELATELARQMGEQFVMAVRAATAIPPGLLPPEELAAALRVSRKTIGRLAHSGMPVHRVCGLARYDLVEVIAWLKNRNVKVNEEPAPRRLSRKGA